MDTRLSESTIDPVVERALIATPEAVLDWAWAQFGDRCCVLASMQDAAVIELALRGGRQFPIVFLDTGYHFAETWATLRRVEQRYGIDVEVVGPRQTPRPDVQPGECCEDKATLLEDALEGRLAWISGVRRHQTSNRASAELVETDRRGFTKVNPVVQWSQADHQQFVQSAGVIENRLVDLGYPSIGCAPCTIPLRGGDYSRAGRWAETTQTECGLHL